MGSSRRYQLACAVFVAAILASGQATAALAVAPAPSGPGAVAAGVSSSGFDPGTPAGDDRPASTAVSVKVVSATPQTESPKALPNGTAPFCYPPAFTGTAVQPANRTLAANAVPNAASVQPRVMQPFPSVASGNAISGRVLGTGGLPLKGVVVFASVYGYYNYAYTGADGRYSLAVPYYGYYLMCFDTTYASDANGHTNYLSGYYKQGVPNSYIGQPDVATTVTVDSTPVSGINLTLPVGHTISGHVIGMHVEDLAGVSVKAYTGAYIGWGRTNSTGNYSITVPSETFRVKFYGGDTGYLSVYYKGSAMGLSTIYEDQASLVTVGGSNVTGVSPQLQGARHINGRVTGAGGLPLAGIYVRASSNLEYCMDDCYATTAADGSYSLTVVPGDSVHVAFRDNTGDYLNGFYRNGVINSFVTSFAAASLITVNADQLGIDVRLSRNHYITGTARNLSGISLAGVSITALATGSNYYCGTTTTRANGTFALDVPNDTYILWFGADCLGSLATVAGGVNYIDGFYWLAGRSTANYDRAQPVTVAGSDRSITTVEMLQPWRLSMSASSTTVRTGRPVGLTATVNQDVSATPWYIDIQRTDGTILSCIGAGTSLSDDDTRATSGTNEYRALVASTVGGEIQAQSPKLAVKWYQSTYHPMTPVRLLDTRSGNGHSGKLTAGVPVTFKVAARADHSPQIPDGASAVTGNLTVTGSSAGWAVYLGPSPVVSPASSTINFAAGQTIANGLTVALSASGYLAATYMGPAGATTDLVFDATGYYTPDAAGQTYHPIDPVRFVDSRSHVGLATKLTVATPACFGVAGLHGLPTAAKAVTGNVTVADSTSGWALYLGPNSTSAPSTSTLNFQAGEAASNNVTVSLNAAGKLCATFIGPAGGGTTELVFDVTGYYTADALGMVFAPISPVRLLDTRSGNGLTGKFTTATPRTLTIASRLTVPAGANAITGNLTVTDQSAGWAIYIGPTPLIAPTTSSLNFVVGEVRANGVSVALSSGHVSATYLGPAGATTNLVLDVTGFFL